MVQGFANDVLKVESLGRYESTIRATEHVVPSCSHYSHQKQKGSRETARRHAGKQSGRQRKLRWPQQ